MIKPTRSLTLLLFLLVSATTHAAEPELDEVVKLEGREVILRSDGSWGFATSDRYANTQDGRRVRLKADGSWEHVGNTPLSSKDRVRTSDLDIKLEKVVIESYRKKVQKNTSVKTQTVFYVRVESSTLTDDSLFIKDHDISLVEVRDNNGKNYPVLSLKAVTEQVKPDSETLLIVRAEKSPSLWDDVKSMSITFRPGIFGLKQAVTLKQRTIDFSEESVDGFDG